MVVAREGPIPALTEALCLGSLGLFLALGPRVLGWGTLLRWLAVAVLASHAHIVIVALGVVTLWRDLEQPSDEPLPYSDLATLRSMLEAWLSKVD